MTSFVAWSLILIVLSFTLIAIEVARASRSWMVLILTLCFLSRVILSIILDGGLKYVFVVDSLSYEYKGWLMAQPWISDDTMRIFLPAGNTIVNSYEVFISWIFRVFGKEPLIATLCNCAFSTATIGLLSLIYASFFADNKNDSSNLRVQNAMVLLIVLSLYPSFLIWSATNTRDPLYFFSCTLFFFCFLTAFSRRSDAKFHIRIISFLGSGLAMWLVLGVRSYVNGLFLLSITAGFFFHFVARYLRWSTISICVLITIITTGILTQQFFPASVTAALANLTTTRLSFANLNLLDSVAKSSFGLDYTFQSIWDVYIFLPNALTHYFLGPFPWEISELGPSSLTH